MDLPLQPPVAPMLAKLTRELPRADGMFYEPKWDGFRCIVFRDGDEVELGSRNEKPLTRYFPELIEPLQRDLPDRCVLDGEIVIAGLSGLDFDALSQRIHPAESRVKLLAGTTPASFVAFDILALGDRDLCDAPYAERRGLLEQTLRSARRPVHLTPATDDPEVAGDWFSRFEGAGLDGVVAKPGDLRYLPDKRAMLKVKHERTADCVVGGFRWHKEGRCRGLTAPRPVRRGRGPAPRGGGLRVQRRPAPGAGGGAGAVPGRRHRRSSWLSEANPSSRVPGGTSRWSAGKDMTWEPLRPELVCEVSYDHLQDQRFRHGTSFRRWRPDRLPASCTYGQLDTPVPSELSPGVRRPQRLTMAAARPGSAGGPQVTRQTASNAGVGPRHARSATAGSRSRSIRSVARVRNSSAAARSSARVAASRSAPRTALRTEGSHWPTSSGMAPSARSGPGPAPPSACPSR